VLMTTVSFYTIRHTRRSARNSPVTQSDALLSPCAWGVESVLAAHHGGGVGSDRASPGADRLRATAVLTAYPRWSAGGGASFSKLLIVEALVLLHVRRITARWSSISRDSAVAVARRIFAAYTRDHIGGSTPVIARR